MSLGILSDAHGNIDAFDKAIALLQGLGAKRYVFLGDAVGYVPSPKVVQRLMAMQRDTLCILGNHEAMLLNGAIDEERDRVYQLEKVRSQLSEEELEFIRGWPRSMTVNIGGHDVLFIHGSPADPTFGYVYPDTDLTPFGKPADYVFLGNSHYPFVRWSANCCFVNPGSCGLPRDDGCLGAAALFDPESGSVTVHRFDIAAATAKLVDDNANLHPSVISLWSRRSANIYGQRQE